ncbi:MAG: YgaP family membrane protein [Bacteroidia bacterium]
MKTTFRFLASSAGRITRILAGIGLIVWGYYYDEDPNYILIVIGIVPLLAGLFDYCVFAPLFGYPFSGEKLRQQVAEKQE